jgi:signal transduction histidine kinase
VYEYLPRSRVERLIASARVILAAVSLITIWLDPSEPARYATLAHVLLAGYVVYAALVRVWVGRRDVVSFRSALIMHVFDLESFIVFLYFTEGATSPFFVYFVFWLLCGAMRWDSPGVVWTAVPALSAFVGLGVFAGHVLPDNEFEPSRFMIRATYLFVTAALLAYLAAWRGRLGAEMSHLAAWPRIVKEEPQAAVQEVLRHAAETLAAPRLVLVWEQAEEPFVHVATWSSAEFRWTQEPPGTFGTIVSEALAGSDFLSPDVTVKAPLVLRRGAEQAERGPDSPLDPALQARFDIHSVLCPVVKGQSVTGRLLALDKLRMTADDLLVGEIVAREVSATMDQMTLVEQLRHAAALQERIGLARNLHDGILQSLAGIDLRLEAVRHLLADPVAARDRVSQIQELVVAEQRDLRALVRTLQSPSGAGDQAFDLASALEDLRWRIEQQWGTRVGIELGAPEAETRGALGYDLYLMVHEAVTNAARHGQASAVQVTIDVDADTARLTIIDNGRGFSFEGRHDASSLARLHLGPVSLRERATARGGSLTLESSDAGARIEIVLPLTPRRALDPDPARRD